MIVELWFRDLWKTLKHEGGPEKAAIGVLAFEVSSLMSKLVYLWQSLSDKQVSKLRDEIMNSVGIKYLVSEDDDFIADFICAEMSETLGYVVRSVARLGKKCNDPNLKSFGHVFDDLVKIDADPCRWAFSWKKMERKVKKMEWFICVNSTMYQEMEMLSELEQALRRMQGHDDDPNCIEYQSKFLCKQKEVKYLQDISMWNRTYDYTVRLLARSIFTIFKRIKHVFGIDDMVDIEAMKDSRTANLDCNYNSHSLYALMLSSDDPSENSAPKFSSGPLGKSTTKSKPFSRTSKTNQFHSAPLGDFIKKSGPKSRAYKSSSFYSGPLGRSTAKLGPNSRTNRSSNLPWQMHVNPKSNRLAQVQPFKGCIMGGNSYLVTDSYLNQNAIHLGIFGDAPHDNLSIFISKRRLLDAPPETLGAAALAQHYANVIVIIEKLVASPHLIGQDARDDLYNMLPASVRSALKLRLKPCTRDPDSSACGAVIAGEFSEAMTGILEWLAPLAHNMIRWQAERSFEQQSFDSRQIVLLVQTLYFANLEKTEAAITELLVGLNYVWRFSRELPEKALLESSSSSMRKEYLNLQG